MYIYIELTSNRCSWVCAVKSSRSHKILFCETYRPYNISQLSDEGALIYICISVTSHEDQFLIHKLTVMIPTGRGQEGTTEGAFDSLGLSRNRSDQRPKHLPHKEPKSFNLKRDWCVCVCVIHIYMDVCIAALPPFPWIY